MKPRQLGSLMGAAATSVLVAWTSIAAAQTFTVAPYLQLATTNSVEVMWETSAGDESLVQWGVSQALGNEAMGTAAIGPSGVRRHEVSMTGLSPATRYYYRTVTQALTSEIYDFITPPLPTSEQSFNLVAMSDMQRDSLNPNKFTEIVQQGVLPFVAQEYGADLPDALALALIPGDLVDNGLVYEQFAQEFFGPAAPLLSHVPSYPVPGNHELDSDYYFDYFQLPQNGTPGYIEHWYYHDYSNLRMIGLDSNPGYRIEEQLTWLEAVLQDACQQEHIDFVFAQLHHPHLSELWVEGELDYTGDVITLMEEFSTQCNKPSIHFFGHTHGYSRGQSRDHRHLWVNVATAGGNIDYWDEYAQADYDEFTVTQDEWGFVLVEVDAGEAPQFRLRRVSRGNEVLFRDNEVRDEVTIRRYNNPPATPQALGPGASEVVVPGEIILVASDYADEDDDLHGASHWQVATSCDDFASPLVERWEQHQNLYQSVDLQAGVDLTQLQLDLPTASGYCWRVRYRDRGLRYSEWSEPLAFSVEGFSATGNLLLNPGAEDGTDAWQTPTGVLESLADGECDGIAPYAGARYFVVGGICQSVAYAAAVQWVNVEAFAEAIDTGLTRAQFGGFFSNFSGEDRPEVQLVFIDANEQMLSETPSLGSTMASWTALSQEVFVPAGTRNIAFWMQGTRNAGEDNDSYLDELNLQLWLPSEGMPIVDDPPEDEGCTCTTVGTPQQVNAQYGWWALALLAFIRGRRKNGYI